MTSSAWVSLSKSESLFPMAFFLFGPVVTELGSLKAYKELILMSAMINIKKMYFNFILLQEGHKNIRRNRLNDEIHLRKKKGLYIKKNYFWNR